MGETYLHRPVLLHECIEALAIRPDGIYLDGTLGRGGHSEEIAKRLSDKGRLLCVDRDRQALEEAGIWGSHLPSWMTLSGAFPICTTPPWICGWTGTTPSPPGRW